MTITIKHIAEICGVSSSAVSIVLSGKPGHVSKEKRALIKETARKLHYTPNQAAVSLSTKRSNLIGILAPDLNNTHMTTLFITLEKELQNYGYTVACNVLSPELNEGQRLVQRMAGLRVDGLILLQPLLIGENENFKNLCQTLNDTNIPVCCSDTFELSNPGPDVRFDWEKAGYLAVKELIDNGHRVIGCISGQPDYAVSIARLEGYKRALKEAGIAYNPKLIFYGDYSRQSALPALAYLMGQKVTAIFSFNDEMAFAVYQSARQYRISIPADVSIIGCDDVPFSDVLEVPLSTISVPNIEMGRVMATELIAQINNGVQGERKQLLYEPALILRASIAKRTI